MRRERLKGFLVQRRWVMRLLFRVLRRDAGLAPRELTSLHATRVSRLPPAPRVRLRLRCRFSGRARQVTAGFQLARMHLRAHAWTGLATPLRLGT